MSSTCTSGWSRSPDEGGDCIGSSRAARGIFAVPGRGDDSSGPVVHRLCAESILLKLFDDQRRHQLVDTDYQACTVTITLLRQLFGGVVAERARSGHQHEPGHRAVTYEAVVIANSL